MQFFATFADMKTANFLRMKIEKYVGIERGAEKTLSTGSAAGGWLSRWMKGIMAATVCLASLAGCSGAGEAENELRSAEMAIAEGDMDVARSVASHIAGNQETNPMLTASQLARLSIVYMQLADYSDEDTNTAMAVNYCRAAMKENADSAEAYYSQLPPDQAGYVNALRMLVDHIDNPIDRDSLPVDESPAEMIDSIPADN